MVGPGGLLQQGQGPYFLAPIFNVVVRVEGTVVGIERVGMGHLDGPNGPVGIVGSLLVPAFKDLSKIPAVQLIWSV